LLAENRFHHLTKKKNTSLGRKMKEFKLQGIADSSSNLYWRGVALTVLDVIKTVSTITHAQNQLSIEK
jgi:hypothetical protein